MCNMDQRPAATAKPTSRITRALLRPENSMIPSIMASPMLRMLTRFRRGPSGRRRRAVLMPGHTCCRRLHLALGIDQKGGRGDDSLSPAQSLSDLDAVPLAVADFNPARFQRSLAAVDK